MRKNRRIGELPEETFTTQSTIEDQIEFAQNPEPRAQCFLLVDCSSSMSGCINIVNAALQQYKKEVQDDVQTSQRLETTIISFGGTVTVLASSQLVDALTLPTLSAGGGTPMGEAILKAYEIAEQRISAYKQNQIKYFRPRFFLITDGHPTDSIVTARQTILNNPKWPLYGIAINEEAHEALQAIVDPILPPQRLAPGKFVELFDWVVGSMTSVSGSSVDEETAPPPTNSWDTLAY